MYAIRSYYVRITAGDTKVLRRGEGGGLYLATTGVGVRLPGVVPSLARIEDGDVILVITSYSIHYTKLYDCSLILVVLDCCPCDSS